MKTVLLVLISVAAVISKSEQQSCYTGEIDLCVFPTVLGARRSLIPQGEKNLAKSCGTWSDMWSCLDKYTSKCFTDLHRVMFNFITSETRQLMNEVCEAGNEFQKEFLQYGACLSEAVQISHSKCMDNLENALYVMFGDKQEDGIPTGCCFFNRFRNCFYEAVEETCGAEAYPLVDKSSKMMCFDRIKAICNSYEPTSDLCVNYLTRNASLPSAENNSYLARASSTFMKTFN